MAHYAWLDANDVVVNVTVGVNETELINGLNTETFYSQATGHNIKRTSYNGNYRFNYAGIGYTFDATKGSDGAFIAPRPTCGHSELTLDETTCRWVCTNSAHEVEMP